MYSFDSRVRYSEVDENKRLSLNGILNYFQDCSTFQSEEVGNGVDQMLAMGRMWVLSSWQIVVNRYPRLCEEIQVSTWPHEFHGFFSYRNFTLRDKEGELLAYANSLWTFLDMESGRPVRIPEEVAESYGWEERLDMTYASRKVPMPKDGEMQEPFTVQRHHLDTNHHVNNGQYVQMARAYIPADFTIHQMRAEYKKSALLKDVIYPVTKREEDRYVIGLCDELGRPYAVIEFS